MGFIRDQLVYGGVFITEATGVSNLFDIVEGTDMGFDMADETYQATATKYIKLRPDVVAFELTMIKCGYVDDTNADQLSSIHFFRNTNANDVLQSRGHIISTGAIAESPLTGPPLMVGDYRDKPIPIWLETPGRLYFMTEWATMPTINAGAEYFFLEVYGKPLTSVVGGSRI